VEGMEDLECREMKGGSGRDAYDEVTWDVW
jgi:hypothetical protein